MKQTVKTSRTAGYLEKMFRQINQDSFNGEIEEPIITIQSTATAYGHVSCAKVWKRGKEQRHELNISADWMNRPIENVVATMIHEMTHLLNMQRGIQDCSRGGSYHNRKFAEEAEKHMIHIEKHEKYGWTITTPTDELLEYILKQGWEEIEMSRTLDISALIGTSGSKNKGTAGTTTTAKPKGNSRKHKCPVCGRIARTTMDFPLICGICHEEMTIEN